MLGKYVVGWEVSGISSRLYPLVGSVMFKSLNSAATLLVDVKGETWLSPVFHPVSWKLIARQWNGVGPTPTLP
jgi:hypothetical protein